MRRSLRGLLRRIGGLEGIEDRPPLAAHRNYPTNPLIRDLTLTAVSGSTPSLKLFETGTSNEMGSVALDDGGDVLVNIMRATGAAIAGDTLRVDLDTFTALNTF